MCSWPSLALVEMLSFRTMHVYDDLCFVGRVQDTHAHLHTHTHTHIYIYIYVCGTFRVYVSFLGFVRVKQQKQLVLQCFKAASNV